LTNWAGGRAGGEATDSDRRTGDYAIRETGPDLGLHYGVRGGAGRGRGPGSDFFSSIWPSPMKKKRKFGFIPLKDHNFGSIPLISHLHVSPHESMTYGVHGIYLKFGSFNGIDPIVPKKKMSPSA
jgi:hypothetical protein